MSTTNEKTALPGEPEPQPTGTGHLAPHTVASVVTMKDTSNAEAAQRLSFAEDFKVDLDVTDEELETIDIFKPLPLLKGVPLEPMPLTVRSVIVGAILGSLVNASNVYLGLKTGFTFGSSMFGAIFGYGIVKMLSTAFSGVPIFGAPFGPQENSLIQASATGAGGLSGLFVAALPAMYNLNLLSENPRDDFGKFLTLTLICSFFGLFFAVPLRKLFIINMARDLRLIFPSSTATAFTIRSMHAVGSGAQEAIQKIKALGIAFTTSFLLRVVSDYALGILWDWHIFTWFFIWSDYTNWAINIENWGWFIEWTPAFIGSGLLVGLNVGISYFVGSFLAWGLIGPLLVHYGTCIGKQLAPKDEHWSGVVSFVSMTGMEKPGYVPSPRFWLLWPGVMVLVCYSMAEFLIHWKVVWYGVRFAWQESAAKIDSMLAKRGKSSPFWQKQAGRNVDGSAIVEDFATPEQQVAWYVWMAGVAAVIAVSIIIFEVQFQINGGMAILSSILGLIFAFLCIHGSGVTDVTPLTASAKASQLVFGGVTHGQHLAPQRALTVNLIAGAMASGAADMSTSLTGDFRVGFLLRTPPNLQFYAQAVGTLIAMFLAPGVFLLFTAAYPCIIFPDRPEFEDFNCPFDAPSVAAWRAVAQAVTLPNIPIPLSSGIFSIVLGVVCIAQVFFKYKFLTGAREKYRNWLPNWMAIGVAFVLPATHYSTAMCLGAIIAHYWQKKWPKNFELYCYAVAAGMMAGEGLGGVIQAALQIGGVGGAVYGYHGGCPLESC